MQSALAHFDDISAQIERRDAVVMLDFDGTLVDIENDPDAPQLSDKTKQILEQLAKTYPIAIISGRSLADIERRVGISGISYAGCHGLERRMRGRRDATEIPAETAAVFREAKKHLSQLAETYGAVIEDKKLSYALHYRILPTARARALVAAATRIIQKANATKAHLLIVNDQCAFDVRPHVRGSKGICARLFYSALKKSSGAIPLYIGDSLTDEDVFRAFPKGITIRVGTSHTTAAHYFLADRAEVDAFLLRLAQ